MQRLKPAMKPLVLCAAVAGMAVLATVTAAPTAPPAPAAPAAPAASSRLAPPTPTPTPEAIWREECGSCHIAFAGKLLPATAWRQLMATLDQHFGVDASLAAAQAASISRYLESHAGPRGRVVDPAEPMRISRMPWFVREHREISAAEWRSTKVKSAANCAACHKGADQGVFEEDEENEGRRGSRDDD